MGTSQQRDEGGHPKNRARPWQIEFDAVSKTELAAAILQYEIEREGPGDRFLAIVEKLVQNISSNPILYQQVTRSIDARHCAYSPTCCTMPCTGKLRVLILNIIHGNRHPKHSRLRMPDWRG